ncbi:unnamed protein product [Rotaria magnacalcarata]|uniref:BEN domain-containing protein n=2 Tax=Rotaria magnacalcarata TaxID=392030 RepID=A0A8S2LCG7_9BILA|nr:unnamed protein product [Rotaria magnacalcarata]
MSDRDVISGLKANRNGNSTKTVGYASSCSCDNELGMHAWCGSNVKMNAAAPNGNMFVIEESSVENELISDPISFVNGEKEHQTIDLLIDEETSSLSNDPDNSLRLGGKRTLEEDESTCINTSENDASSEKISLESFKSLRRKIFKLEQEVNKMKKEFKDNSKKVPREHQVYLNPYNGDVCDKVADLLGINQMTLRSCHRKTSTATCRNILKQKYSQLSSGIKFSHIESSIIDAIIKYTKISNPSDTTTENKIRRSMSLYFSEKAYKAKQGTGYQRKKMQKC